MMDQYRLQRFGDT